MKSKVNIELSNQNEIPTNKYYENDKESKHHRYNMIQFMTSIH